MRMSALKSSTTASSVPAMVRKCQTSEDCPQHGPSLKRAQLADDALLPNSGRASRARPGALRYLRNGEAGAFLRV